MKNKNIVIVFIIIVCVLITILTGCKSSLKGVNSSNSKIFHGRNKRYISVGDSITFNDGKEDENTKVIFKGYQTLMNDEIGFKTVKNYGISGASMAKNFNYPQKNGSLAVDDGKKEYSSADLITIFAGTNDFKLKVKLGKIGNLSNKNFDLYTFYGAYRSFIENIERQNKSAKIYLFTPIQRNNAGYDINYRNSAGYKLIDYVNAVKNIGKMYNLTVIDLYATSGININNLKIYTVDGLHPNNKGYKLIANSILKIIQK
jgi:lysophospholipase L1-like esterase